MAPAGYVAGAGRGASTYGVDQGSNDNDGNADAAAVPMGGPSEMETLLFARDSQFDDRGAAAGAAAATSERRRPYGTHSLLSPLSLSQPDSEG